MEHDLSKKTTITTNPNVTHTELLEWITNEDEVKGLIGGFEVPTTTLNASVPIIFPNSEKIKYVTEEYTEEIISVGENGEDITIEVQRTRQVPDVDEDGEIIMIPKTWADYVGNCYKTSVTNGKVLIPLGIRDDNGNRLTVIESDEFYLWVNHFSTTNLLTKSDYVDKIFVEEIEDV